MKEKCKLRLHNFHHSLSCCIDHAESYEFRFTCFVLFLLVFPVFLFVSLFGFVLLFPVLIAHFFELHRCMSNCSSRPRLPKLTKTHLSACAKKRKCLVYYYVYLLVYLFIYCFDILRNLISLSYLGIHWYCKLGTVGYSLDNHHHHLLEEDCCKLASVFERHRHM